MKTTIKVTYIILMCVSVLFCSKGFTQDNKKAVLLERLKSEIMASDQINEGMKTFASDVLLKQCSNPIFVSAVKKQNQKNMTIDEIKKIDSEWKASEGEIPLLEELMNNACAEEAQRLIDEHPIFELFVMDNQGANVGQNAATSDYWQGDEAKWQKSFNAGKGGIEIGKMEIDESTTLAQQQISIPIIDEDGSVIGAVCFGIDVKQFR